MHACKKLMNVLKMVKVYVYMPINTKKCVNITFMIKSVCVYKCSIYFKMYSQVELQSLILWQ